MRANYRRETKELMKQIKIPMNKFCLEFGISPATYRNWVHGLAGPQTQEKFERLKALASGALPVPPMGRSPDESSDRLYQLTIQIGLLQESIGAIKDRLKSMEVSLDVMRDRQAIMKSEITRIETSEDGSKIDWQRMNKFVTFFMDKKDLWDLVMQKDYKLIKKH